MKSVASLTDTDRKVALIEDHGFTEVELSQILREEFKRVNQHVGVKSAVGRFDEVTGEVLIEVWAPDTAAVADLLEPTVSRRRADIGVTVTLANGPQASPQRQVYGGSETLHNYYCTSGFTVRKWSMPLIVAS